MNAAEVTIKTFISINLIFLENLYLFQKCKMHTVISPAQFFLKGM